MNAASFKLALAQIHITPGDRARNLDRAMSFIDRAAMAGAQIVLLPEALPVGWMDHSAQSAADEIPSGDTCRTLAEAARKYRIFVCSGLVERAGQKLFNAAVLIDPSGEIILHHRKINELEIAHHLYALGDRLAVAETPLGKIGL
ncbi:MAG: carbon-nitrogen hydrolase family protein, partial [Limisphaerales bacterium]